MCEYCKDIRNGKNLYCDIFSYTKYWNVKGLINGEYFMETQIIKNMPVKYCPACGRKLGD